MKPTLFLLAAGMGSRYGGLKQLDGLGPNGETIMDYSIYDAIEAGFGKIVWVIRKDFEEQFRTQILADYLESITVVEVVAVDYAERLLDNVLTHKNSMICSPRLLTTFWYRESLWQSVNTLKTEFALDLTLIL